MFDIGWTEFFIIAVIALLVVGPKDLPKAVRTVTAGIRKVRGLAREFQSGLDEMVREAELDDLKEQVDQVRRFDAAKALKNEVDPTGTLTDDFDPAQFNRDLLDRVEGGPPGPKSPPDAEPTETPTETPSEPAAGPAEKAAG